MSLASRRLRYSSSPALCSTVGSAPLAPQVGFCRSVVIVGGGPGTVELEALLSDHVEAGYRVKGVVGPRPTENVSASWLGASDDILEAMEAVGANGAFVVVDELSPRNGRS